MLYKKRSPKLKFINEKNHWFLTWKINFESTFWKCHITLRQFIKFNTFLGAHYFFFDQIKQILDTPGLNKDLLLIHLPIFSVTPNIQQYLQVFMLNENVIPRNQIEIVSKLSSGQFGYVYKGKSNSIRLSLNKNWTSQKWHSTCALINHFLN